MENENENENQNEDICYCYNPICKANPVKIKDMMEAHMVGGLWRHIKETTKDRTVYNDFKKDFGFYKSPTEFFTNKEVETIIESRKLSPFVRKLLYANETSDDFLQGSIVKTTMMKCCLLCPNEEEYCNESIKEIETNECCENYNHHIKGLLSYIDDYKLVKVGDKKKLLRDLKENKSCKNVLKWFNYYNNEKCKKMFYQTRDICNGISELLRSCANPEEYDAIKKCLVRNINYIGNERDNCFDFYWKDLKKELNINMMNGCKEL
jgi:hypothetical protein